jgi:hypothetical protein
LVAGKSSHARQNILMKADHEPQHPRGVARTLSLVAFGFMSLVSFVLFYTEDQLSGVDYLCLLILGAPFALGALSYFVGLHHDPTASN